MSATMYQDDLCHFEEFRCRVALAEARLDRRRSKQFSEIFGRCRGTRFVDAHATEFAPASIQEIIKRDLDQCGDKYREHR